MCPDASPFAGLAFGMVGNHFPEAMDEAGGVAVHGLQVGFLGRQAVVHQDFAAATFAHDRKFHAFAESRAAIHGEGVRVENDASRCDVVVGDITVNVFDEAVVPHADIVERGVADARVARRSAGEGDCGAEGPDAVRAGEMNELQLPEVGVGGYGKLLPIFGHAALPLQLSDFCGGRRPVCLGGVSLFYHGVDCFCS